MTDTITFLVGEQGKRASKMWLPDGTTADYDAGWRFQPHTVPVADLAGLSAILTQAQTHSNALAIRGTFRGDAHAQGVTQRSGTGDILPAVSAPGWYRRWKELFDDVAHHWMCIDIDGYVPPASIDPVLEPVRAIHAFIKDRLPASFDGAGFHWQLSSSAGHARNVGVLKAHVWFWLNTPMTCADLTVWSDTIGPAIDRTLYRVVQVHYTALPVFAPGVVDPVPIRCGLVQGPVVTLVLDNVQRALADTLRTRGAEGGDRDLIDPRTKTGIVGAFCRAYSIESLLETTLANQFEYERGSDRRLTWLQGGGATGGAYITDDRLHVCNTHNTSPSGPGALNAFDLVRVYCFGHLDAAVGVDPLALVQMGTRPSYRACCEWAAGQAAVIAQMPQGGGVSAVVAATADVVTQPAITPIAGETLLLPAAQVAYFANCVYVASVHRILTPDGESYDQQRFNAMYGGRSFVMDPTNARTVRSAWECFLESQALTFPKVTGRLFRPELPAYSIIKMEGASFVNTYVPIETRQVEGDPSPFVELVTKMLPDVRDRSILLTYLASMLRNPGVKFQWWPVLQGAEGNGKNAITSTMEHCVGSRYTELLNVAEMAKNGIKFNSWIVGCLLLIVDEVYVDNQRHFLEEFKTTVTNKRIAVEQKGVDKTTEDNRANGIMCTNHDKGVPVTADSRRYAIFYTAQQTAEDKIRDGMTPGYFRDLYDWLNKDGMAIVNWWLRNQYVLVDEFDPAGACQVAPKTTSSTLAIKNSLGVVEQEILEAIESDQEGFRGNWISSIALDKLLDKAGRRIARNQRRGMLKSLGYDWHPHLRDGRTTCGNALKGHPGKFNLYCKLNSEVGEITDNAKIMERYFIDQRL